MVRSVLSGENKNNQSNIIDVRKYEKQGSLVIIDSVNAYFHSDIDLISFLAGLAKQPQFSGKKGISVIADLASFSYFNRIDFVFIIRKTLIEGLENNKNKCYLNIMARI